MDPIGGGIAGGLVIAGLIGIEVVLYRRHQREKRRRQPRYFEIRGRDLPQHDVVEADGFGIKLPSRTHELNGGRMHELYDGRPGQSGSRVELLDRRGG